ncbi:3-oxoacyl-ACP reductase [Ligilactobacillus pabuli]|uniref:3-oxoacyl-ACP reductase n=1 Tax=Ligilactobacillus pabuli TaxID=2886039 RepID=A0ABQ5JIZ2_9LACO|nr:SDR family oxidoreductase [Ligilactobacillus pabuli]GKS81886.1 3-oxoacyl-ACP reductase [Ligilactobacillus pabuli]HIW89998.1 SDR family oxidoreductase [Candidatus Ligilactobacillus excrementipullorum]
MQGWALILGASGDIGTQTAQDLAQQGWSLYLHYFNHQEKAQQLQQELHAKYPRQDFLLVQADLTQPNSAQAIAHQLFGLDAVIFAQGTTDYGLFAQEDPGALNQMLAMQVQTPLSLVQILQPKLAASQHGRIVFVGSVYGGAGSAMEVGYSTVKGALTAFASAYSQEVASMGITVNVIAPGAVATRMNLTFTPEERDEVAAQIPAGHFAQPEEISYWICSLLDQRAGYLTGQTIYVTGGWLK